MDKCKSCGQPIRWVKTKAGKSMPIDVDPQHDGLFATGEPVMLEWTMKSHFATCPDAAKHRRPR